MGRWSARLQHACRRAGVLLLVAALGGCAGMVPQTMQLRDAWPQGVAQRTEITAVPFFPQLDNQCGPAALATALVHSGVDVTPETLARSVYLPARQGSLQIEMLAAPRRFGRVAYPLAPRFGDLLREVAAGNPVIVLQDIGLGPVTSWHYAVVVGFDYPAGELYLRSGESHRVAVPFTIFEYSWKQSNYWAMMTLAPDQIPATATEAVHLAAIAAMDRVAPAEASVTAYTAHLARWPASGGAIIGLANRSYTDGDLARTEALLRQGLHHAPDSVPLLNNLAQTLSDLGRNDEALVLIERAQTRPQSPFDDTVRETRALIVQRMASSR